MIAIAVLILLAALLAALHSLMRKQPDRRSLWRTAVYVGVGTGVARAAPCPVDLCSAAARRLPCQS